jgi:fumarylpyruvate hydrolase
MIWSVPEIIANLSHYYTLRPGDVIFTGTPAGVGPAVPGDELRGQIADVGEVVARIVAADSPAANVQGAVVANKPLELTVR